jgi:hypothetical protein
MWTTAAFFAAPTAFLAFQELAAWHADRQAKPVPSLPLRKEQQQPLDRPNIQPVRVYTDVRSLKGYDVTGQQVMERPFSGAHVDFKNIPTGSHPNAEVLNVLAEIRFFYKGQLVLQVSPGRWGDSKEPSMVKLSEPGASLYHLNTIPFRIGEVHELNLAIKYPEQTFFYAFNNDS